MIHPKTEVRHTGTDVGLGVFATAFIPKGTIVYAMDRLEIVLPGDTPLRDRPPYADGVQRFAFRSPEGRWIISWDHGKYVNHNCQANTLNTGYGFEIAVEDIPSGRELTDDYGMLNLPYEMPCLCGAPQCRGTVRPDDFDRLGAYWEDVVRKAIGRVLQVQQPLWNLLSRRTRTDLRRYCRSGLGYRTVLAERYAPQAGLAAPGPEQPAAAAAPDDTPSPAIL